MGWSTQHHPGRVAVNFLEYQIEHVLTVFLLIQRPAVTSAALVGALSFAGEGL